MPRGLHTLWLFCAPPLMAVALVHGAVEEVTSIDIEHNLKFERSVDKAPPVLPEDFTPTALQTLLFDVHVVFVDFAPQASLEPTASRTWERGECVAPPFLTLRTTRLQI